jgi:hypothetical protein
MRCCNVLWIHFGLICRTYCHKMEWKLNELSINKEPAKSYSLSSYDIFALWMFSSRLNEYHIDIFCSISNEVSNVHFYRLKVKRDYFVALVILTGETVSVVQYGLCRLCPHRGLKGPTWHPAQKHNLSVPPGNATESRFSHRGNTHQLSADRALLTPVLPRGQLSPSSPPKQIIFCCWCLNNVLTRRNTHLLHTVLYDPQTMPSPVIALLCLCLQHS